MSLNLFVRQKVTLPLICLLVYSAIIPMQLSDYVLCIGEDGHCKIEYIDHGCCHHNSLHEPNLIEADHCGECLDLPIFACINTETAIIIDAKKPILSTLISIISPIPLEANVSAIPNTKSLTRIPPLIDPTLKSLRTVTLLI